MFDEVLVPTDGSDCAAAAVGNAVDIASHYGATVHVLSVLDSRSQENAEHQARDGTRAEAVVDEVTEEMVDAGLGVERTVRTGVPYEVILEYVDEAGIDLVVMGTHGRTGVERYLLGSVTEKVLRRSDVPVLTIRDAEDGSVHYPYESVLVPTDGSAAAGAAADVGLDLATRYGSELHVVSIVDALSMGVDVRSELMTDALEASAREAVDGIAERAGGAVGGVETAVAYGSPYKKLRRYVEENDVDLVVMGTHGRTGLERYLLGSVTEKLVRTSPVPVLTVRTAEAGSE
ncbi:universal stress protein [Haloarchaeobius iranensis]|uniref:Nucleotide-binding universal stress protein, UspA family n=1 Tax=Haloarchaeobius iranensis TaxID=996166 RepID=A0A1G9ZLZ1_9EURY|nr:universal stress protein [Haloarchaeobius iranensis]SDN22135.1 Nucleotide-binding universal stress protein, UspA family [Haloarchaeobius iranensis]